MEALIQKTLVIIPMIVGVAALVKAVLAAVVPKLDAFAQTTKNTVDDKIAKALATALTGITIILEVLGKIAAVLSAQSPKTVSRK